MLCSRLRSCLLWSRSVAAGCVLLLISACQTLDHSPVTPSAPQGAGPSADAPLIETQPATPPPTFEPPQPLPPPTTRSYSLSSASRALVNQAEQQRKSRNLMQAGVTLERALRIEPNNPLLWLEYAELRMDEGNYAQADNLARKALALASGDARTQAKAWTLIADSLAARDKNVEAQQATNKANTLLGR